MKQKLCVIGEALIDFIPQRKGCSLQEVEGFTRVAGGAPANVAGAVAKMGVPAMVLTQLGKDAFGDHIIASLKESGIDTSHILQSDQYDTSLSFVSLREDGNRDFKFYRRTAADLQYGPENITADLLDDCGMVHFCSVSLVESPMKQAHRALLELAKQKGVLVSFDPNLRFSLWDDKDALYRTVHEFLPYADILKLSDEELEKAAPIYTVFGRVSPEQKKKLLLALKKAGNVVAMTGDGVNDVLALKEADCSIAMASGSEAASNAAQIVLLDSDFARMPSVVLEGRRVVNNIQRSASLFSGAPFF